MAFQGCDVTREDSVRTLIEEAEKKLKSPLYCFINNAGTNQTHQLTSTPVDWNKVTCSQRCYKTAIRNVVENTIH